MQSSTLALLQVLRSARQEFFLGLTKHARKRLKRELSASEIAKLQKTNTSLVAEFYYLIDEGGHAASEKSIRKLFVRHNQAIQKLIGDPLTRSRMGLHSPGRGDRLSAATFKDAEIERIAKISRDGLLYLSQSDLARLLFCVLPEESCRQTIEALDKFGLLNRIGKRPNRTVYSNGELEMRYRRYLLSILERLNSWRNE